ncbi:CCR3 [Symbiodinium natans]|uniref:CCR3 protein n=1 Tax=Symbiodinium natans TaxID=878477 RepID=A0A812PCS5_9DINO|nr:CCR3 [Symbiodinium natans]
MMLCDSHEAPPLVEVRGDKSAKDTEASAKIERLSGIDEGWPRDLTSCKSVNAALLWREGEDELMEPWDIKQVMGFDPNNMEKHKMTTDQVGQGEAISTNARARARASMSRCQRFIVSPGFDQLSGFIILLHCFSVGMEADQRARDPVNACGGWWVTMQFVCNVLFVLELLVRLQAFGVKTFFCGHDRYWNWFDLLVILSGIGEEILSGVILFNSCERPPETGDLMTAFTILRIMRLLRITRLIRAVRFMPIFRELRVMVRSILNCLMPLTWCLVLLGFFQWCFAVYFITVTSDHVQAMHMAPERYSHIDAHRLQELQDQIKAMFGSLWRTNYVLFMSVSGGLDWGYASDVFITLESYYAAAGYLFFIALVALAVLNVVTAVFVEYAMKMAADDRDLVIQDTLARRNKYMKDAMLVFKEADADGSGSITFKEFLDHVEDERVQAFLNSMELDGIEAIRLFKLLDLDGSGSVEPDEFVHGCMCLKGMAKTIDLAILLREQKKAMQRWSSFMSYVDICLTRLMTEEHCELPDMMAVQSSRSRISTTSSGINRKAGTF